ARRSGCSPPPGRGSATASTCRRRLRRWRRRDIGRYCWHSFLLLRADAADRRDRRTRHASISVATWLHLLKLRSAATPAAQRGATAALESAARPRRRGGGSSTRSIRLRLRRKARVAVRRSTACPACIERILQSARPPTQPAS